MATTLTAESVREEVRAWLADNWNPDLTVGEWWTLLTEAGYAAPTFPEEAFGRGYNRALANVVNEEITKAGAVGPPAGLGYLLAAPTIATHATDEQKKFWLQRILDGTDAWCQLFSEPEAGSDLANITTRAVLDGDEWVVTGQKVWTSAAHRAEWGILLARTDIDAPKHRGITYLLVDMSSPGIEVRPLRQMTGDEHFSEVFLDDVRIPQSNVVGEVGEGWRVAQTTLASERGAIAGGSGGADPPGLIALVQQHGRADDPLVRQAVVEAHLRAELLRFLRLRAQTALSQGTRPGAEASVMKLAYARFMQQMTAAAMHVQGATAMLADPELLPRGGVWTTKFLHAPSLRIAGGSDQVQGNIIGERVLGLPAEARADKDTPFRDLAKALR